MDKLWVTAVRTNLVIAIGATEAKRSHGWRRGVCQKQTTSFANARGPAFESKGGSAKTIGNSSGLSEVIRAIGGNGGDFGGFAGTFGALGGKGNIKPVVVGLFPTDLNKIKYDGLSGRPIKLKAFIKLVLIKSVSKTNIKIEGSDFEVSTSLADDPSFGFEKLVPKLSNGKTVLVVEQNESQGNPQMIYPDAVPIIKEVVTDVNNKKQVITGDSTMNKRHDLVKVVAAVSESTAETKVFFRAFDVDDPSSDAAPVDDENLENDNRGTPQTGTFHDGKGNKSEGDKGIEVKVVDKEAVVYFQVTMQPGDNFKIAACVSNNEGEDNVALIKSTRNIDKVIKDANNNVTKESDGLPLYKYKDGSRLNEDPWRNVSQIGKDHYKDKVKVSETLTVYRKLYVERDSMNFEGLKNINKATGKIDGAIEANNIIVGLKVKLDPADNYAEGKIKFRTTAEYVYEFPVNKLGDDALSVILKGPDGSNIIADSAGFELINKAGTKIVHGVVNETETSKIDKTDPDNIKVPVFVDLEIANLYATGKLKVAGKEFNVSKNDLDAVTLKSNADDAVLAKDAIFELLDKDGAKKITGTFSAVDKDYVIVKLKEINHIGLNKLQENNMFKKSAAGFKSGGKAFIVEKNDEISVTIKNSAELAVLVDSAAFELLDDDDNNIKSRFPLMKDGDAASGSLGLMNPVIHPDENLYSYLYIVPDYKFLDEAVLQHVEDGVKIEETVNNKSLGLKVNIKNVVEFGVQIVSENAKKKRKPI